MLLYNELKLTTPILGCKVVTGKPRQLLRDAEKKVGLVSLAWQRAFTAAAASVGITYTPDMVLFPTGYDANKFDEHLRVFGKNKFERFESIPQDAVISFEVVLNETRLSPTTYADILREVGENHGVSQWGTKWGYGLFSINVVKQQALQKLDFHYDGA